MKLDIFKFMADVNPTAKRIENGKPTNELYTKKTIYNTISGAIKDKRIIKTLKVVDDSQDDIKYIFSNEGQHIEVLIPNSNNDYIGKFDQLVKLRAKIVAKNIGLVLAGCAIAGTIVGEIIYADYKEYKINQAENQNYVDELNKKRRENGVDSINYLEKTVDEAIAEADVGGRKL